MVSNATVQYSYYIIICTVLCIVVFITLYLLAERFKPSKPWRERCRTLLPNWAVGILTRILFSCEWLRTRLPCSNPVIWDWRRENQWRKFGGSSLWLQQNARPSVLQLPWHHSLLQLSNEEYPLTFWHESCQGKFEAVRTYGAPSTRTNENAMPNNRIISSQNSLRGGAPALGLGDGGVDRMCHQHCFSVMPVLADARC